MTINFFKKKILVWDDFDKDFHVLENSINTKIVDLRVPDQIILTNYNE